MSEHLNIQITSLPERLSYDEAVEAAYREDLDWIEGKLRARLSVLIECDKQLSNYIYKALRKRFRSGGDIRLRLLSGHPRQQQPDEAMAPQQSLTQRLLDELREAIYNATDQNILTMTHLDILTTTTRSSLGVEAREAAAIMYENPDLVFLGFTDPEFEIPPVIEKVFAVKHEISGISRETLPSLILQKEARKFGVEKFNPFKLYKFVSGLNAVRCRQILDQLQNRLDFDPNLPGSVDAIYQDIRRLTLVGDLEIPRVDLDKDIGGYGKVKEQIRQEILDLLVIKEHSDNIEEIKAIEEIIPKGMIFYGPPGTGKTFFAKAIATALNATVSVVSGPELKSKWVGESEENLRRVFAQARKSAPSIIIFDELDSFASARGTYTGSGVEHSMVNQLLTEMDGFRKEELVFVVGTTNFSESLDPALLRPGRFELTIHIPYPEKEDREEILKIYDEKFNIGLDQESTDYLVKRTDGFVDANRGIRFSGDHLYALMRGLKREQLRRIKDGNAMNEVTKKDIDTVLGKRKKDRPKLSVYEERTVAIHEAGHAILAYVLPHCPTVERITISSEEGDDFLGYVMHAVSDNQHMRTRSQMLDSICVCLGGRQAEMMLIEEVSSGCMNDLRQATGMASMMVEQLGMSEVMGLRTYRDDQSQDSRVVLRPRDISETTAARVDEEIHAIIDAQRERCDNTLREYRTEFEQLIRTLLDKKTIGVDELNEIFDGREFKVKTRTMFDPPEEETKEDAKEDTSSEAK